MSVAPVVIVLAAGAGRRFIASGAKTHKLDTLLHHQSVLGHVLTTVKASGLGCYVVRPAGGTAGIGESIALGVKATANAGGWLILPADLPLIRSASLRQVAQELENKPIVVPFWQQQAGHPVGFAGEYFTPLSQLTGDCGGREIVRAARKKGLVLDCPVTDRGIVQDIDTLADLHLARHFLPTYSVDD